LASYLRFDGNSLPCGVGTDGPNGTRISDGRSGHICYGPYISLDPGHYIAGLYIRLLPGSAAGSIDIDVVIGGGDGLNHKALSTKTLFDDTPSFITVDFKLDREAQGIEVRAYVHAGILIEITELVVFSTRERNWGGS